MAGQKFFAHGMTITVDSVAVEGLESIELDDGEVDEVETTDSNSQRVREYVAGLGDSGELTMQLRYIPGATGQANLRTLKAAGTTVEAVITLPDSATDDSLVGTLTFDCWVRRFARSLPAVENTAAMATCVLRLTGSVAEAVA
jgi:hypothetical protein